MHHLCIGNAQNLVSGSEASWVSSQTHCQCLLEAIKPNKSLHKSLAINQSILSVVCTNSSLSRTSVLGSSQKQWGANRFRVVDGNFRVFDEIAPCLFFDRIYDRLRLSVETFASSSRQSPFTEPTASLPKNCSKKFGSDTWADASPASREEVDIELQLPELKETLCLLKKQWASEKVPRRCVGSVFLVGTGPGDPELLTLKALRLMQTADLVLYDRLVSTEILDMVHAGARLLYVGKTSGYHSRTQEEIHQLLLSFAEAGATVVRLKGGDPLVFGRGGEEMDFLQAQGIRVNIVPGITAASGIAAELGIPLTHRGAANSVRFLTGHSRKGGTDPLHVAEQAADPDSTLVIYMGLQTLPGLAAKLMANGLASDTPAAAVERGTTSQQRTVFAYLKDLPSEVQSEHLVSPTLIIIGQVVMLSPFWPSKISLGDGHNKNRTNKCVSNQQPRDRSFRDSDPALPSQLLT